MPVKVACQCGHRWEVDDALAGKRILCAACKERVRVPGMVTSTPRPRTRSADGTAEPAAPPSRRKPRPRPEELTEEEQQEPDAEEAAADEAQDEQEAERGKVLALLVGVSGLIALVGGIILCFFVPWVGIFVALVGLALMAIGDWLLVCAKVREEIRKVREEIRKVREEIRCLSALDRQLSVQRADKRDRSALPLLIAAAADSDRRVRAAAYKRLGEWCDRHSNLVWAAAAKISQSKSSLAKDTLLEALEDRDITAAAAAARALSESEDPAPRSAGKRWLHDHDAELARLAEEEKRQAEEERTQQEKRQAEESRNRQAALQKKCLTEKWTAPLGFSEHDAIVRARQPLGGVDEEVAQELVRLMAIIYDKRDQRWLAAQGTNEWNEARSIGSGLYANGGRERMLLVYHRMRFLRNGDPGCLRDVWDGVGGW